MNRCQKCWHIWYINAKDLTLVLERQNSFANDDETFYSYLPGEYRSNTSMVEKTQHNEYISTFYFESVQWT